MKERVIVAIIGVPLLFVVMFFLPPYAFTALIAAICAISAYELTGAIGFKKKRWLSVYAALAAAFIPIGEHFKIGDPVFQAALLVLMSLIFIEAIAAYKTDRKIALSQVFAAIFGGAIIPYLLSTLVSLRALPEGRLFVLLPVISAFLTDAGAYFVGVLIGKHPAFPNVSPNKTIEGFVGGLVIGTLSMLLYGVIIVNTTSYSVNFAALIFCGLAGALFTELGDLAFSLVKREYNIKDFGTLLPGHGGVLDRFDSMIFTAPALYLLVTILPEITVI